MQIDINTSVSVPPALNIPTMLNYADLLSKVEGRDLYKHIARMNVAAGDLAANATEGIEDREDIYDEVAGLLLRATIFGLAYGMSAGDLMAALGRETGRLIKAGIESRIADQMNEAGFGTPSSDPFAALMQGVQDAIQNSGATEGCSACASH